MMTNRWINWVLSVVVLLGLTGVVVYEQPQLARERAEFLGQEVAQATGEVPAEATAPERIVVEPPPLTEEPLPGTGAADEPTPTGPGTPGEATPAAEPDRPYGVSAGHPIAVDIGMQVLEAGGTAVDAAVAVSYALAVVEPFGSGIGGGGAMLVHPSGGTPVAYDYREIAPRSGELPASEIGVPGFVAGMAHVHAEHGRLDFATLIEPAIQLAEGGIEVSEILNERLRAAAFRMPIHQLPGLFPAGTPIAAGEVYVQPEHAEALRAIRDEGPGAMYGGWVGQAIVDAVSGLELEDLEAYEVLEVPVAQGRFRGYDVLAVGPPVSGPTLVQQLQILDAANIHEVAPGTAQHTHLLAQSYRIAIADRSEYIGDPSMEDVPLERLLDEEYAAEWAGAIPGEGFVAVDEEGATSPETDTTHVVVVDRTGTMVSVTNTLSNFFGSGLAVSGFFLSDQLKNFSRDPESVNAVAPGKRSRSFITPAIVARDGVPLLGLGSPGGRRIPIVLAQVVTRWAAHGQPLEEAVGSPRVHLERRELQFEVSPPGSVAAELRARGYGVVDDIPFPEYYGAIQALEVDPDTYAVSGVADERRDGTWQAAGD